MENRDDLIINTFEDVSNLIESLEATLQWIDAVPDDTPLPVMPGFDRDWVNNILTKAKERGK